MANGGALMMQRSIPEYAGEPRIQAGKGKCPRVYPRVCGGTPTRLKPG